MSAATTVEEWARWYIETCDFEHKLSPPPPPAQWKPEAQAVRLLRPGRPPEWQELSKAPRTVGASALQHRVRRAQQFHAFLHHELQAAELMAWAILAFPDTPAAFRHGLLGICRDELRHLALYRSHLETLGFGVGDFPVRDWFWLRVPEARTPAQFVALMGLGLEGGNLDHSRKYADRFREAGDEAGAKIQEQVCEEEVAHVRFAVHWFREFTGGLDFDSWQDHLPPQVAPSMLRAFPLNRRDRERAGLPEAFVHALGEWSES